jgi:hypothetical protein
VSGDKHEISDEKMALLREMGAFICHCNNPSPYQLGAWRCFECRTCGRLVLKSDEIVELAERMASRRRHPTGRPRHPR